MALDFPASPTTGQTFVSAGTQWVWDGAKWVTGTTANAWAPINSPIFTGDPQAPTPATADSDTSVATTGFVKAQGYALGSSLAGYLPLSGGTINGNLSVAGPGFDPFQVIAPAGASARTKYTVQGQRAWTCGTTPTGTFNIADETAGIVWASVAAGGGFVAINGDMNLANLAAANGVVTGVLLANQGLVQINRGSSTNPTLFFSEQATSSNNRMVVYFDVATGRSQITDLFSGGNLYLDPGGNLTYGGSGVAYKAGGGSWTALSDARIKTVDGDYTQGLTDILALRPVRYRYNGNDTDSGTLDRVGPDGVVSRAATSAAPYPASLHYIPATEEKVFVGLIAQEVEPIFPGMVATGPGYIDGAPVEDLRTLDTTELIYALVNSVKTLHARIAALEAASPPVVS